MCSQKYGRYGLADDESECRRVCLAGSPEEKCGGAWKNAVYRIGTLFCCSISLFGLLKLPYSAWNEQPAANLIMSPINR